MVPADIPLYRDFIRSGVPLSPQSMSGKKISQKKIYCKIETCELAVVLPEEELTFADKLDLFRRFIQSFLWIQKNCIHDHNNWKHIESILVTMKESPEELELTLPQEFEFLPLVNPTKRFRFFGLIASMVLTLSDRKLDPRNIFFLQQIQRYTWTPKEQFCSAIIYEMFGRLSTFTSFGYLPSINSWSDLKQHIKDKSGAFSIEYQPLSISKVEQVIEFLGKYLDEVRFFF